MRNTKKRINNQYIDNIEIDITHPENIYGQ